MPLRTSEESSQALILIIESTAHQHILQFGRRTEEWVIPENDIESLLRFDGCVYIALAHGRPHTIPPESLAGIPYCGGIDVSRDNLFGSAKRGKEGDNTRARPNFKKQSRA